MMFSVQATSLQLFREAVDSKCDSVRFGSEFCEWCIPDEEALKEANALSKSKGKEFTYVTPRVSDSGIEVLRAQLTQLNELEKTRVVVNDLGVLGILGRCSNLRPHLGRHMIYIPARCPWNQITEHEVGFLAQRKVEQIYYQTSLNYESTIKLYKSRGVLGVDVDWIPRCFPYFEFLTRNGLTLSIHTHLVPVTSTRKCHMARFLGEKDPETCSRPCLSKAFLLRHDTLGTEFFLEGNTVFRFVQPSREDVFRLHKVGTGEVVITTGPATGIETRGEIDQVIESLRI